MENNTMQKQVILFAHGSSDPVWQQTIEKLRDEMAPNFKSWPVIAYMERAKPKLETVLEELYASGARKFLIVPLFLAPGGHVTNDVLPLIGALKGLYPDIEITTHDALLESTSVRQAILQDIQKALQ